MPTIVPQRPPKSPREVPPPLPTVKEAPGKEVTPPLIKPIDPIDDPPPPMTM